MKKKSSFVTAILIAALLAGALLLLYPTQTCRYINSLSYEKKFPNLCWENKS